MSTPVFINPCPYGCGTRCSGHQRHTPSSGFGNDICSRCGQPVHGSAACGAVRLGDQPLPKLNEHPIIQHLVIADMHERLQLGVQRYGTGLQAHNGRDMLRDAYEEALDLAIYLRGYIYERDNPAAAS